MSARHAHLEEKKEEKRFGTHSERRETGRQKGKMVHLNGDL